jgi:cytidylate kinase
MAARYKLPSLEGKIIAIDGPSGSGKSTTARLLAQKLGFIYLDTGATDEIRSPEVTRKVSEVSAHPEVRKVMVAIQKELGKNGHIVAEGRDTTSVVFPEAHVKVYLDASLEARAQRRFLDMTRSGVKTTIDEQKADLIRRDKYDSTRKASPLKKVRDALTLDTSHLTIEEQVERIIKLIRTKIGRL